MWIKYVCMVLMFAQFATTVSAQQLPSHVTFKEFGLSFDVPPGWSAYLEGDVILMGHQSIPGLMIMTENQSTDMTQLKELAMQAIQSDGLWLKHEGKYKVVGQNRLEGFYQGTFNSEPVKAYALGLINFKGKGVNVIILTATNQFSQQHKDEANKLASSIEFHQTINSQETIHWKQKLLGNQLKYIHTSTSSDYSGGYSGTSERVTIELCFDGSFYYASSAQNSFDGSGGFGYSGNRDDSKGSFKIYSIQKQSHLQLTFINGHIQEFQLSSNEQGNTFLNNSRYLVLQSNHCD